MVFGILNKFMRVSRLKMELIKVNRNLYVFNKDFIELIRNLIVLNHDCIRVYKKYGVFN